MHTSCLSNSLRPLLAACACALGLAAASNTTASAAAYNAVADFSLAANPNGAWSYGSLSAFTGGTFSLYTVKATDANFTGSQLWENGQSAPNTAAVLKNTTDQIQTNGGSVVYLPGTLELDETPWRSEYLYSRASTIYGGTAEIQRNIIARRLLDLGKE